jgi:hypothetical protein
MTTRVPNHFLGVSDTRIRTRVRVSVRVRATMVRIDGWTDLDVRWFMPIARHSGHPFVTTDLEYLKAMLQGPRL